MAKRSYLNTSTSYIKAKPGMRGMSSGSVELPEEELKRKRLIAVIKDNSELDSAYRRWQLGQQEENDDGTTSYNREPTTLGSFDKFAEEYNSPEAQEKRAERREKQPRYIGYSEAHRTSGSGKYVKGTGGKAPNKPLKVILIKKKDIK